MYKTDFPSSLLANAVEAISSLPGIGQRSALRLALHLLRQDPEKVHQFTQAIDKLRDEVHYCSECHMIADAPICNICSDTRRDHNTICVVENVQDVMSIEATGQYHGVYHVLGGIISPINGIGPSDINIQLLVQRLRTIASRQPNPDNSLSNIEVILALPGDVEGETTSFYIYRQIAPFKVDVTTIARGLGFGDGIEYADALTLGRSITGRQPFKIQ